MAVAIVGQPLVSVIVPVYNVESYLRDCIDSILGQSYVNIEVILVDDGSTDGSPSICDYYAGANANVSVIHKSNGGLSDARNVGLEASNGEFVTFVDSDDWLEPEMIERCMRLIDLHAADFCGVSFMLAYPDRRVPSFAFASAPEVYTNEEALARYLYNTNIGVCVCGGLYRKSLWSNVRCPVGKLHEDQHTKYLLLDRVRRAVFDPEPLYNYRQREGSIGHSAFTARSYDLLDGVDAQYDYISEKYPSIEGDIAAACSFWYVVFVNMMIRSDCWNEDAAKRCQFFARAHLRDIIGTRYFQLSRKAQLALFSLSLSLYKHVYLLFVERNGKVGHNAKSNGR